MIKNKSRTPKPQSDKNININNNINQYNAPSDNYYDSNPGKNNMYNMNNISNMNNMSNLNNVNMPNLDFTSDDTGESIRVCIRIRPMNVNELGRQDTKCVDYQDNSTLFFKHKSLSRSYNFIHVFNEHSRQEDVFNVCSINKLIENVLDGYSVTVFAYGQTGSGKTYTIIGRDDTVNDQILGNNEYIGMIPRAIKYLWSAIGHKKNEKYFIKASFLEIYNEQINDLLSPKSSNLQIRWTSKQGFFVENLLVIDCQRPQDIAEILLEGTKNRKIGSHELNKDSSRSHSILTIYVISEFESEGHFFQKFGKISFVDLAGSERLKESKSQGDMIKETGNINKSLFTLGKVISTLTDKKQSKQHIPYRDSKLTMLLMDSIGGSSKTLMIACISPSNQYADETMGTLNYAARTMTIKNRPIVQMDPKEQLIMSLKKENDYLRQENDFLKKEFFKVTGQVPVFDPNRGDTNLTLPLINMRDSQQMNKPESEGELARLKEENIQLRRTKEIGERQINNLMNENSILSAKLDNLENVFIGSTAKRNNNIENQQFEENYNMSAIMLENNNLKKHIDQLELEKSELKEILSKKDNPGKSVLKDENEINQLNETNIKLMRRVEFLQKRERELLETIMKLKNEHT